MKSTSVQSPPTLSAADGELWLHAYQEAFDQTADEVLAELAAWGAIRKERVMLFRTGRKSANGNPLVGGWGMLFTDQQAKDVDDQYFDATTETLMDFYAHAPLWYEHGQDPAYGADPIGKRVSFKVYPRGIVVIHELFADHPHFKRTIREIDDGDLVYSSDTLLHYAQSGFNQDTGHLGTWFAAGWSLTSNPAEPALGAVTQGEFVTAMKRAAAEAHEAQSGTQNDSNDLGTRRNKGMFEQLLKGLAGFFGVEETIDAVKSATEELANQMETPEAEAEGADAAKSAPDLVQLRAALGLPEDAEPAAIAERLRELITMMETPPDGTQGTKSRSLNYGALSAGMKSVALNAPPLGGKVPNHTPTTPGKKAAQVGNYNRGAKLPGLADLVLGIVGKKSESAMKSLGYSIGPNGGYFLRAEVADEILEFFRAEAILAKLGATVVDMKGIETLTYRKQLTGANARYRGEGQVDTGDNPTWGTVQLQLKELIASTNINRRLLKNSAASLERMIRDDMQKAINLRADLAGMYGTGGTPNDGSSGAEPRGVRYTTGVTVTPLATNGRNPGVKDFIDGWGRIEDANVPVSDKWGIAFSPRTKRFMENLLDTTGQRIDPTLWTGGHNYAATTQISNALTVGSSSDCSEVILGAWEYLIIGVGQDIEIIVDESVDRKEGEIYVEATMMHDVGVAQPIAFEVITGVRAV